MCGSPDRAPSSAWGSQERRCGIWGIPRSWGGGTAGPAAAPAADRAWDAPWAAADAGAAVLGSWAVCEAVLSVPAQAGASEAAWAAAFYRTGRHADRAAGRDRSMGSVCAGYPVV